MEEAIFESAGKTNINLQKVIEGKKEFNDDSFSPNQKSLFNAERTSRLSKQEIVIWKEFTWERPDKIFNGQEPLLF